MVQTIPIVNLPNRDSHDSALMQRAAGELDQAFRDVGFAVIANHGVSAETQRRAYDAAIEFFRLPIEEKQKCHAAERRVNRGYVPYGEDALAQLHGEQTPPDYKEFLVMGPPDRDGLPANIWPADPAELRLALEEYYRQMELLTRRLSEILATALHLSPSWFLDKLDRHASNMRLNYYPQPDRPAVPGQLRCGEHEDVDMLTILRNDVAQGGLQVKLRHGDWVDVPAIDDTFVINVGDLLMRWTNDIWVSTTHRVAVPEQSDWSNSERLSIAFFLLPNADAEVRCIESCQSAGQPPKYPPTTVQEYSLNHVRAAFLDDDNDDD